MKLIKKILLRILSKPAITKDSPHHEIIRYKEEAWQSSRMAEYYNNSVELPFFNAVTASLFTDGFDSNLSVLDVGAGTGRVTYAFASKGFSVTALDISKPMLDHIEATKGDYKITAIQGSGFSMDFGDEAFDIVTSMDVDIHFPNWENLLAEKVRVCKTGGYIIFSALSQENQELLSNPAYVSHGSKDFFSRDYAVFLSDQKISEIAAKYGLEVVSITPFNFMFLNSMLGGGLTLDEARMFSELYWKAMTNSEFRNVIAKFEKEIVRNLTAKDSVTKMVRLKKIRRFNTEIS